MGLGLRKTLHTGVLCGLPPGKAQDHQRQLADFPRRCGLHAAAVGGSIHVANIYERRMTLGAASTLVAPSNMRQHLKLSAFDMLRVCGALL